MKIPRMFSFLENNLNSQTVKNYQIIKKESLKTRYYELKNGHKNKTDHYRDPKHGLNKRKKYPYKF